MTESINKYIILFRENLMIRKKCEEIQYSRAKVGTSLE
jgi:hypothetical protein